MSSFVGSAVSSLATFFHGEPQPPLTQDLQQAPAAAAHNAPGGQTGKAVSAAPGGDPLVRTEPEKYGRAVALLGAPVPAPHILTRDTSRESTPKAKLPPVRLDDLVKEWRTDQAKATHRALRLGDLAQRWIVSQPERPADAQYDRAGALKAIRKALLAAGIDRRSCRVDRYVRCWHVARLLGGEPESLSISAIRECQPLVERDRETDRWQLTPAYAEQARGLWARMHGEHLSAEAVRTAVQKILPARTIPIRKKKIRLASVLRAVPTFSRDQLLALQTRIGAELAAKATPAAA